MFVKILIQIIFSHSCSKIISSNTIWFNLIAFDPHLYHISSFIVYYVMDLTYIYIYA